MKYENLKVEIIAVQNEDILTLSVLSSGKGMSKAWDSLGFTDPGSVN